MNERLATPLPRPQYILAPDGAIFSVFHPAAAEHADERRAAVLFCAPWGWNETNSYHSRRTWAEALAAEGHPVLRFELPAVGDSAGTPHDAGLLERWIGSVVAAAGWLRAQEPGREVAALGMELGGLLALEGARAGAPIDALAIWATPRDGRGFVRLTQAFSRMQAWPGGPDGDSPLPEGAIEAAGFVLSAETAAALRELKPAAGEPPAGVRRALVLGRDDAAPDQGLVDLLGAGGATVEAEAGLGWDKLVSHPGYTEPPPLTMERFSRWLAAGAPPATTNAASSTAGTAPAVASSPSDTAPAVASDAMLTIEGAAIRETPLDYLPENTFGILAEPAAATAAGECFVFLNAGNVRHIGPNRLWVDAARTLAAEGVCSLRADLAGIGEASGEGARFAEVSEFYEPEFGEQIKAIFTALEDAGVARSFVLVGLCSGGYWAFRIGIDDRRVSRVLLLNPGFLRWRPFVVMVRNGKGLGMLLQGRLWRKLFRGEFALKKLRAFGQLMVRRLSERASRLARSLRRDDAAEQFERDRDLERDFDSLRDAATPTTIAFSAAEIMRDDLEAAGITAQAERWPNLRLVDLPGIDHALAPTSAQAAARRVISAEAARAGLASAPGASPAARDA